MSAKHVMDVIYTAVLIFNALLYIPQARLLIRKKCSKGTSLFTFIGFSIIQVAAIANGYYYKDPALVFGRVAGFITCSFVVFLIVYYRVRANINKNHQLGHANG